MADNLIQNVAKNIGPSNDNGHQTNCEHSLGIISRDLSKAFDPGITLASRGWSWRITDHNNWFGSSNVFVINNVGQLLDHWDTASNLTLQLACDKGVFSAHVCFAHSRPNGGHKLIRDCSQKKFCLPNVQNKTDLSEGIRQHL